MPGQPLHGSVISALAGITGGSAPSITQPADAQTEKKKKKKKKKKRKPENTDRWKPLSLQVPLPPQPPVR
jgi:hypothetical protein